MRSNSAILSLSVLMFVALRTADAIAACAETPEAEESTLETRSGVAKSRRPVLQVINGSGQPIEVYWIKSDRERVSNGRVEPGTDILITTTLGHRFTIVGQEDDSEITVECRVPVQAIRFDQSDKDGTPAFYTIRVSASGFPIVASANVNPYALKEAAYLVDLMLANRPDIRTAMIQSGARLCILAHNEFTTDQPEFAHLSDQSLSQFHGISSSNHHERLCRGLVFGVDPHRQSQRRSRRGDMDLWPDWRVPGHERGAI